MGMDYIRAGKAKPWALPLDDFTADVALVHALEERFGQAASNVRDKWRPRQRANRSGQILHEELSDACSEVFERWGWLFQCGTGPNACYEGWESPPDEFTPQYMVRQRSGRLIRRRNEADLVAVSGCGPRTIDDINENWRSFVGQQDAFDNRNTSSEVRRRIVWLLSDFARDPFGIPIALATHLALPVVVRSSGRRWNTTDRRLLFTIALGGDYPGFGGGGPDLPQPVPVEPVMSEMSDRLVLL